MVRDAVLQAAEAVNIDRLDITVIAFDEAMPMACVSSDWGVISYQSHVILTRVGFPNQ